MTKLRRTRLTRTRTRLIGEASRIFAERGYRNATTRQICARASANAAAINYHFGGKLGLYKQVIEHLIDTDDRRAGRGVARAAGQALALRRFIEATSSEATENEASTYRSRLMMHELCNPTPGLEQLAKRLIGPRSRELHAIVAILLGKSAKSAQTRMCVHSVMSQVLHVHCIQPKLKWLWPEWVDQPKERRFLDHVAKFSLFALTRLPKKGLKRGTSEES
jgi:AcrR family transcriptional regulator